MLTESIEKESISNLSNNTPLTAAPTMEPIPRTADIAHRLCRHCSSRCECEIVIDYRVYTAYVHYGHIHHGLPTSYCQDGGSGNPMAVAHSYCYKLLVPPNTTNQDQSKSWHDTRVTSVSKHYRAPNGKPHPLMITDTLYHNFQEKPVCSRN